MKHTITINPSGHVLAIYDDDLRGVLGTLGPVSIKRASYVEPDEAGLWWADMEPLNGPRIGPYTFRREALAAERDWLEVRL